MNTGKKTLWILAAIYVLTITVYIILHSFIVEGSRLERISADDVKIIKDSIEIFKIRMDTSIANIKVDSALVKEPQVIKKHKEDSLRAHYLDLALKHIDTYLLEKYKDYLSTKVWIINTSVKDKSLSEISAIAPNITIPLRSYFWFGNEYKYLEVVFWSLFGVLCSLLFVISENLRINKSIDNEVSIYWAKLFYTPAVTLIIIWGYKQFVVPQSQDTKIEIDDSSYGLLVAAFIIGFFSRRGIDMLNKIKDVLLPASASEDILSGIIGKLDVSGIPPAGINYSLFNLTLLNEDSKIIKSNVPVKKDLTFEIPGVKPGKYIVKAVYNDPQLKRSGKLFEFVHEEKIEVGRDKKEINIKLDPVNKPEEENKNHSERSSILNNETGPCNIKGKIIIKGEGIVDHRSIIINLKNETESIVKGSINSDELLNFNIKGIKPGKYLIEGSAIGNKFTKDTEGNIIVSVETTNIINPESMTLYSGISDLIELTNENPNRTIELVLDEFSDKLKSNSGKQEEKDNL